MGRYLQTLTRLFLAGAFPQRRIVAAAAERAHLPRPPAPPAAPGPRGKMLWKARPRAMESKVTHPGEILARHLHELGLTASDLARDINVPVNRVTAIINGQRGVTADTALRLGHWFGVDAEDWLELQLQYELGLTRREVGAKIARLPRLVDRVE